jgi:hypothetical protein
MKETNYSLKRAIEPAGNDNQSHIGSHSFFEQLEMFPVSVMTSREADETRLGSKRQFVPDLGLLADDLSSPEEQVS